MSCFSIEELYAYLEGELAHDAVHHLEAHALACPDCRALLEDRRAFMQAAASLPDLAVPDTFAASLLSRLDSVPAPHPRRPPLWTWLAATGAAAAAFSVTLGAIILISGQNLWEYLARLQHGLVGYLQGAVSAIAHFVKYVQIFLRVAGELATAAAGFFKSLTALLTPPVQAAFAGSAVLILVMGVVFWRRRKSPLENEDEE
jgi:hypothetical protein